MSKILPILLLVFGAAVGSGAGLLMKSDAQEDCTAEGKCDTTIKKPQVKEDDDSEELHYVTLKNQFVVPIIKEERVQSLVVLSLSLELNTDDRETIFSKEPKIRDVILQVLFDHAHIGGFDGEFTESSRLSILKVALLEATQNVIGQMATDVIITDIVRQEM